MSNYVSDIFFVLFWLGLEPAKPIRLCPIKDLFNSCLICAKIIKMCPVTIFLLAEVYL